MIRVSIPGANGRMGRALIAEVSNANDIKLVGACEAPDSQAIGKDAGLVAGQSLIGVNIVDNIADSLQNVDVVIDFTLPHVTTQITPLCAQQGIALVIGTTGLSPEQKTVLQNASKKVPIVWAPNMSVGINVLLQLAAQTVKLLGPEYNLEIIEAHHCHKKDAPSGTALRIAEVLADATQGSLQQRACYGRKGQIGERPKTEIGIHAVRGGDIVGEHTIMYCTDGERVELTHRASTRQTFTKGAIRAVRWIVEKKPGLYDMRDVLGLSG